MKNQENTRVVTLQAGETVILTAEDGTKISEVKKPKRNTTKEREWEKEKYHRFTFLIDKQQAQQLIDLLGEKRPLDWFREQITHYINYINNTFNVQKNTLNVQNKDISDNNINIINDNTLNDDTLNVQYQNKDILDNNSNIGINNNTLNVLNNDKSLKPPITPELIEEWYKLNNSGISFDKIIKMPIAHGYGKTTISKSVLKHKMDTGEGKENIIGIMEKLQNCETREAAAAYFAKSSFDSEMLKTLARQYSVPNYTRLKKQDLIEKLIETTVGAKLRFESIYNTKTRI